MVGCRKSLASLPGRQGPRAECYPAYRYAIRCDGIASMWFACRRVRTVQADVVQPGTWPDVLAGTIDPVTSHRAPGKPPMKVLVVDVGGTHVKILATGQREHRQFVSGPTLTAEQMVTGVKALAQRWKYDVVSM